MTDTATTAPGQDVKAADTASALVEATLAKIAEGKGKVTLAEAVAAVMADAVTHKVEATAKAPAVPAITDDHRKALADIVEQYGQVTPASPRLLTKTELTAIVKERQTIDTILTLLTKRKDTSIREALANHLDKVAERDNLTEGAEKDGKGHWQIKQDEPVPNTDLKVSKTVSEPKPVISTAELFKAYTDGRLTREEWLAITTLPEVPRVFDEQKARTAIKKNPGLLAKIASATSYPAKTTTIKVNPDKG